MLLNYHKEYKINQPAYTIFQSIEKLDFRSNILFSNRYNLIHSIDSTEPLQMTFYLDQSLIRRYIPLEMSLKVIATFISENSKTTIFTSVKTSPFFYLWYAIGIIGALLSFFRENNRGEAVVSFLVLAVVFFLMDMYYRRKVSRNFELVLYDAGYATRTT